MTYSELVLWSITAGFSALLFSAGAGLGLFILRASWKAAK